MDPNTRGRHVLRPDQISRLAYMARQCMPDPTPNVARDAGLPDLTRAGGRMSAAQLARARISAGTFFAHVEAEHGS